MDKLLESAKRGWNSPIEQTLDELRLRHQVSGMHDDSTLEPYLAALFLGISLKKLEQMRLNAEKAGDSAAVSPPFIKMVEPGAAARNQAIRYKLGDLKAFQDRFKVNSSFEASLKAGVADWTKNVHQFYVTTTDTEPAIVAAVNDFADPERVQYFYKFIAGDLDVIGKTLRGVAKSRWVDGEKARQVKDAWRNILQSELDSL